LQTFPLSHLGTAPNKIKKEQSIDSRIRPDKSGLQTFPLNHLGTAP
jgi:hypothetical protein